MICQGKVEMSPDLQSRDVPFERLRTSPFAKGDGWDKLLPLDWRIEHCWRATRAPIQWLNSRAEQRMFCPFAFARPVFGGVALLAAQKAINAKHVSISVCAIGSHFLNGFAIEVIAILSPRVIVGWWFGLL